MAEFLVVNMVHSYDRPSKDRPDLTGYEYVRWQIMDRLPEGKKRDYELAHFEAKYQARYIHGDIVDVREDGFWSSHPTRKVGPTFSVVSVPGLSVKDYKYLSDAMFDTNNLVMLAHSQHRFKIESMSFNVKKITTVATINSTTLEDKGVSP